MAHVTLTSLASDTGGERPVMQTSVGHVIYAEVHFWFVEGRRGMWTEVTQQKLASSRLQTRKHLSHFQSYNSQSMALLLTVW